MGFVLNQACFLIPFAYREPGFPLKSRVLCLHALEKSCKVFFGYFVFFFSYYCNNKMFFKNYEATVTLTQ